MPADSPNQDVQKAASAAKGTAQAAKGAKTTIQAVSIIAKAGTGPAGWIMLAKQFAPQIQALASKLRKAAAIAAAYLLYLLWLLLQKILGIIAGLAFGAVTGIPLLFIPGAGPFLYVGYVGFWGYRGMVDPAATIHIATHPWEAITKPLGWVNDKIFNLGSATKGGVEYVGGGVSQGVSGAISGVGNFVAGAASGIWNAAVGAVGNAIGWGSSLLSGGFNLLSTSATAATATIAKVAVGGAVGTITTVSIISSITTNTAFSTTEGDLGTIAPPGENVDFIIAKTANPASLGAPGPDVTFTITLTAKSQPITAVGFVDNFRYTKGGAETPLTASVPTFTCTLPIAVGTNCVNQFKFNTFLMESDSTLINTVLAKVTLGDGLEKQDSSTVSVPIGAPSSNCPSGWPTGSGSITQGVQGGTSHYRLYPTEEAIDIGYPTTSGTPTLSTFTGTIIDIIDKDDNNYGIHVDVEGLCNGSKFTARWAHLESIDSSLLGKEGSTINGSAPIGKVGSTGFVTGPHLHYSFFGLHMTTPYIPQAPPNTCNDSAVCGVSW